MFPEYSCQFKTCMSVKSKFENKMRANLIVKPLVNFKTSISVTSKFLKKIRANLIVEPLYNNVA